MGKTYAVDSSGHAPKGVVAGDFVKTAGGTYEVLDGSKYKNMTNDQLAQAGVGFNPATGLYSKKVNESTNVSVSGGTGYGPTLTSFDGDAWKDNFIKQQIAGLDKNYALDSSALTKTYNTNKAQFNDQITGVNKSYDDAVSKLEQDAYINNIMAKQYASSQGLTSSGQGIALAQSVLNDANTNAVGLWKSKEESINSIEKAINQLSANFNIDKDTLRSAYNADKLGVMSGAEVQALEQKLKVDMSNAGIKNDWDMVKFQTENDNQWKAKELELAYKQLAASRSGGGGGSGNSQYKLNAQYEIELVTNYEQYLHSILGEGYLDKLTPEQRNVYWDSYAQVKYGIITAEQHVANITAMFEPMLNSQANDIKTNKASIFDKLFSYTPNQEAINRRQNYYKSDRYWRR